MKIVDLSHLMNVHTPGWVGYAGNQMAASLSSPRSRCNRSKGLNVRSPWQQRLVSSPSAIVRTKRWVIVPNAMAKTRGGHARVKDLLDECQR
jgi:hypothetical protein